VCCGNCVEQIVFCVDGILGNRYFCVFWEFLGTDIVVCCGICREQLVLCLGGIVGKRSCSVLY